MAKKLVCGCAALTVFGAMAIARGLVAIGAYTTPVAELRLELATA